jgi:hypothetical protein
MQTRKDATRGSVSTGGRKPFEIYQPFRLRLSDLGEHVIDCTRLRLALVLVKVGLKLLFRFVGVNKKLLSRPESQFADIAIPDTRGAPDESGYLEIPVSHANIIAAYDD